MRFFLAILMLLFVACSDDVDSGTKVQNDALDSSKTIKLSNSANIIDENSDTNATKALDSTTNDLSNVADSAVDSMLDSVPKQDLAQSLYAKCIACHGAKGDRVAPGSEGEVLISKLSKEMIISDLKGYRAKTLKKGKSAAIMYLQSANLSDEDIESLGEYISSFGKFGK